MLKKLIGSKTFYKEVLGIVLPIMIQQGITTFVGLLDNIMVGQLNENAIAGVAIANQIMFIVLICFIGGLAGPGIFVAQYFGAKDEEALKQAFRAKVILATFVTIIAMAVLLIFKEPMITAFAKNDPGAAGEFNPQVIRYGVQYLTIMAFSLPVLAIIQLYASTFREIRETTVPMVAGIISVIINFVFNYLLIFGKLGFPALEVEGAAIATVIARVVEASILLWIAYRNRMIFAQGIFTRFHIEAKRFKLMVKKTLPLLTNELLWSSSILVIMWAYAQRGTSVYAAFAISSAVSNLFFIVFGALATGISVMVGNELGANQIELAKENAFKLLFLTIVVCLSFGAVLAIIAPFAPYLYNVADNVRAMATQFMWVVAALMWVFAFNAGIFFVLRAGGMVILTFLFDATFAWVITVPLAIILSLFTDLPILLVYALVEGVSIIKGIIGMQFVKSGKWARNLTHHENAI
ncbi:MATE family efflux transporter [Acholeplasma manati]|uniref:Probable multidrug resistance protein NorM n=1 Tax=Paracholeplasma manati TaxID=591373 RepID=A0ABT2Y5S2_9MOLU|nr:MATE family efflux transporter [Paracholeplasma manati]MCV2232091.1 MATE family efflux transporter [Paracholeplasma manati]